MRAIIIDDERLARAELKKLLQDFPEVEVIDEAANAEEGISKIEGQQPDLIFLDIQMPGKRALTCWQNWKKHRRSYLLQLMMSLP